METQPNLAESALESKPQQQQQLLQQQLQQQQQQQQQQYYLATLPQPSYWFDTETTSTNKQTKDVNYENQTKLSKNAGLFFSNCFCCCSYVLF